ncbi:molecular chaperone DnaJ [Acidocella aminolytica]|jgi:molecular chaperone DnaJ|uniref:Chaperone protein DnaJ n=1 Tax=Acidocella aminolytica 101 = DSM 11237 TaxID=1120923 RepID=A0A0D6PIA3_9PROT|nr:molecular chaperone DnaJ [Acidocella aminolytica]GAN80559.1 chaperone protein DnaJ [Acidocella aminolytica 101 = DSM 11237]GBQ43058.1 molecular chaperone DnaJ [Acidocella aminolytica 101 = DSM 11237]SHE28921.1 molecular chaperone DnaJ [Acidocella aminolytica 101 = DSM 11237]
MAKLDYYAVLMVERSASADELKKAYRKLAMQHHPDRNPGDAKAEQKFKEINEAYDVLKDEDKRAAYDRYGHAAFENGGMGGGGAGFGGFGFEGGLGDIFEQMFGGGGRRGAERTQTGADIKAAIEIDLTEAFTGTKANVRVSTRMACDACGGSGSADKNATADNCSTCGGIGRVRAQQGFFVVERTCPTCGGAGRVVRNPCRVCSGVGTVPRERTLAVQIPAGVEDGTRIRLSGEGEAGPRGTAPGDLYVHVAIRPHPIFQRDGANIFCRVPLRMGQAALGGEVEVPSIDGTAAKVKIPAGTQSGDQFRLRGKGFSVLRSTQRGDMYIQVAVETPQNLTKRQRELLEEFEQETAGQSASSPEHEGFFAKVKEFLKNVAEG